MIHASWDEESKLTVSCLNEARQSQASWALKTIRERLCFLRRLRHLIAENACRLARVTAEVSKRPPAEKLVSEVLPLADACRWLYREATRILAPRRCGMKGRPIWMSGLTFEVQRQPFGVLLVIGAANYPLIVVDAVADELIVHFPHASRSDRSIAFPGRI